MHSQHRHEYGGNTPQEGNKKGPYGTVGSHLPWPRLVSSDHLLLMASAVQFALFVPLAWWAHKHPQPPVEVGIIHVLQKKQPRSLQGAALVLSTIAGSAAFMNIMVVPTALLLWKRHLRLEAVMTVGISWTSALEGRYKRTKYQQQDRRQNTVSFSIMS